MFAYGLAVEIAGGLPLTFQIIQNHTTTVWRVLARPGMSVATALRYEVSMISRSFVCVLSLIAGGRAREVELQHSA